MTKERFVYLINFIKDHYSLEARLCDVLEAMSPGCYVDAFVYSDYASELTKTIKEAMGLPEENEDIEYFMYDLNFGHEWAPGTITDANGKDINLSSAENVYDYLIETYGNKQ